MAALRPTRNLTNNTLYVTNSAATGSYSEKDPRPYKVSLPNVGSVGLSLDEAKSIVGVFNKTLNPTPAPTPAPIPTPTPTPDPTPVPTPVPTPSDFELGVVLASNWSGLAAKVKASGWGPTRGRISTDQGSDSTWQMMVRESLAVGIKPHIQYASWQDSAATFVAFVKRYRALGVNRYELGNETSYVSASQQGSTAPGYARQVQAYAVALKAAGITDVELLVQADAALRAGSQWVSGMYSAVPNLHDYVYAWVVHPYTANREVEQLNQAVKETTAKGSPSSKPIIATEYGIASTQNGTTMDSNYGWPTNLKWTDGGPLIAQRIAAMRAGCPQLKAVYHYHATDGTQGPTSRESNFGSLTWPSLIVKQPIVDALKTIPR